MSKPPGLGNAGGQSALNSVVQCLLRTDELLQMLQDSRGEPRIPIVRALRELLLLMSSRNHGTSHVYNPAQLAQEIVKVLPLPLFPEDVLQCILDAAEQDDVSLEFLTGVKEHRVKCEVCGFTPTQHVPETFTMLWLPIQTSLVNAELLDFIGARCRKRVDKTKCTQCSLEKCIIETVFTRLPDVLFVNLCRAVKDYGRTARNSNETVAFPKTLDVGSVLTVPREEQTVYRLYGVIAHEGPLDSGHFAAYVHGGGCWTYANDTFTGSCSWNDVSSSAYGNGNSELRKSRARTLMYRKVTDGLIDTGKRQGISSVLQCLAETLTPSQLDRSGAGVTKELAHVLSSIKANHGRAVNPGMFIDSLALESGVSFTFEEDPDVILRYIIDALDRDKGLDFAVTSWQTSTVDVISCLTCQAKQSLSVERSVFPVAITHDDLLECIRRTIDNVVTKECVACNDFRDMMSRITIKAMPMFLVIRLDRPTPDRPVGFPQRFNSSVLSAEYIAPSVYHLYAVIAQSAESVSAYTKTNGSWFHKEDTVITACRWEDVTGAYDRSGVFDNVACMLWYRRVDEHCGVK